MYFNDINLKINKLTLTNKSFPNFKYLYHMNSGHTSHHTHKQVTLSIITRQCNYFSGKDCFSFVKALFTVAATSAI